MTNVPYTRWLAGASLVVTAVGAIGCGGAPTRTHDSRSLTVFFDEAEISESDLIRTLCAEHGVGSVQQRFSRKLYTGSRERLSALVVELQPGLQKLSSEEWSRVRSGIETCHGVTGVERSAASAVRGAPKDYPWPAASATAGDVLTQPALAQVNVGSANGTGDGVTVAMLDGGFDLYHEFVDQSFVQGYDAIDDDNDAHDVGDGIDQDNDGHVDGFVGHGTFGSGLVISIAPDAAIMPIRVLDDEGHGTILSLWLGISAAVDAEVDVINLSLVASTMPTELQNALLAANAAGIDIVTAGGNDPAGPSVHPFLGGLASVVGACNLASGDLGWSPLSSGITVYAPGEDLLGPLGGSGANANSYGYWDGTSFSAAIVAGSAALVRELQPGLTPAQVRTLLKTSVVPVTGCDPTADGAIELDLLTR